MRRQERALTTGMMNWRIFFRNVALCPGGSSPAAPAPSRWAAATRSARWLGVSGGRPRPRFRHCARVDWAMEAGAADSSSAWAGHGGDTGLSSPAPSPWAGSCSRLRRFHRAWVGEAGSAGASWGRCSFGRAGEVREPPGETSLLFGGLLFVLLLPCFLPMGGFSLARASATRPDFSRLALETNLSSRGNFFRPRPGPFPRELGLEPGVG